MAVKTQRKPNTPTQNIMAMFTDSEHPLNPIIRFGILAGIVLLYVGVIGMIEAFHDRDIIEDRTFDFLVDPLTLGQLLLVVPSFFAGFYTANKMRKSQHILVAIISGAVVGALTAIPSLLLLTLNTQTEVRETFPNVNRDWIEIITFDNRNDLLQGGLFFTLALTLSGLVGSILNVLPKTLRNSLIAGLALALSVSVMGSTVRLILQESFDRDVLDEFFRRDTMLLKTALGLFALGNIGMLIWQFTRQPIAKATAGESTQSTIRIVTYALIAGALLALPLVIGRALSDTMVTIGLFVLMGLGLNIAIGLAGLLDLGYVTNYAVGAYVMAVLTSTGPLGLFNGSRDYLLSQQGGDFVSHWMNSPDTLISYWTTNTEIVLSFWMVIPIALISAMVAGFIFAVPVLKMRGDYLAIATLGFGEIIGRLAVSDAMRPIIGGAQGVLFVPNPNFFGTEIKDPEQLYYVILFACFITLLVSIRLNNSRTGRQWMAIREDEDVAAAMGIDTARAKLLAFTLSAATGGVAGAIFAAKVGTVFPNSFTVFVSINVLSLIIVGGMGSNPGIVLGAIVLIGLPELLREFSEFRWLMYGVLLIWMMINRPEGLLPSQVRRRELKTEPSTSGGSD